MFDRFTPKKISKGVSLGIVAAVLVFSGFFVLSAGAVISSIDVIDPGSDPGQNLRSDVTISWTAVGDPGDLVDIYYSTNNFGITTKLTVDALLFDDGSYTWDTVAAGIPDNANYKIKIESTTNGINGISPFPFLIDNTLPLLTINEGTDIGPVQTDTINVLVDDVMSGVDSGTLEYGFSPDALCDGGDTYGNLFSSGVDFFIADDHTDYLCVKAADVAGNVGYQLVGQLSTDNTLPVISSVTGTTIQDGNDTIAVAFDGPVFADDGLWADGNEITVVESPDNTPVNLTGAIYAYDGGSNTLTITLDEVNAHLHNGDDVAVTPVLNTIRDAANNFVIPVEIISLSLVSGDVVGPAVALTYDPDRPVRDADTVTITATFNEALDFAHVGIPQISMSGPGAFVATDMSPTGNPLVWTYAWDVPAGDGTAAFSISATDLAGNVNSAATNNTRTVDNTPPSIASYTFNGNATSVVFNPNNAPDVAIVVNADEPVDWVSTQIFKSDEPAVNKDKFPGGDGTLTTSFDWDGSLSNGGPGPIDGVYEIKVHITDLAGNDVTNLLLVPHTITVDTADPTVGVVAPVADDVYKSDPPLQFTPDGTGTAVECSYVIDASVPVPVACTSTVLVDTIIPGLSDGRHSVTVTVTDEADNSVSSSPVSFVYDNNNTLTVDDTPANNPDFATIQTAVDAATTGDTISVAEGIYSTTGQVLIDKDLTIVGSDPVKPIISPASNVTGDGAGDAWILVDANITFNLSNVVLDGDSNFVYQALRSHGNTTIDNVDFRDIRGSAVGSPYRGIAIASYGGTVAGGAGSDSHGGGGDPSHLVVSGSTFEDIGRIGVLIKGTGATAEITGNSYTGKGVGDWLDYAFEVGAGGDATIGPDNTITGNRGVASIDGSTSAGILVTDYWGPGTSATIIGNTITDSTEGIAVGYDGDDESVVVAHSNQIAGNDGGIFSTAPTVDAEKNWWGSVSGPTYVLNPGGAGDTVSDFVDYSPWCTNPECTAFGSNDPREYIVLELTPTVVTLPDFSLVTVTSYDEDGYVRVNESAQVLLTTDGSATFDQNLLGFTNGIAATTITDTVASTVNVTAVIVGDVHTDTQQMTFTTAPEDVTPPVVNSFSVGSITETGATLSVVTNENTTCNYATTDSSFASMTTMDVTGTTVHSQDVTGLSGLTGYDYYVRCMDISGNVMTTSAHVSFTTSAPVPDTTPPTIPVITTSSATTDADTYAIAGGAADDGGVRTVRLYNDTTLVGTLSLPTGETTWVFTVSLDQDAPNIFTATSADEVGNVSIASVPVTITEATAIGDIDAPGVPVITTADDTVDADVYTLTGTAGADLPADGTRVVTISRDGTVVGSLSLLAGETDWSFLTSLAQNTANSFTATSTDIAGNTSPAGVAVIITEADAAPAPDTTAPMLTDIQVVSITSVSATITWTTDELATSQVEYGPTSAYGPSTVLDPTLETSHSVSLSGLIPGLTYHFRVLSTDAASNPSVSSDQTFMTAPADSLPVVAGVTGITAVKTSAVADDTYANGWEWVFDVTLPMDEASVSMKFNDWVSGGDTILAADNIRFFSGQASVANSEGAAVTISEADVYSGPMTLITDLDASKVGRQVRITVQVKVPLGSVGGSYSTSYGVKSTTL